jgi:hypothetical protein
MFLDSNKFSETSIGAERFRGKRISKIGNPRQKRKGPLERRGSFFSSEPLSEEKLVK